MEEKTSTNSGSKWLKAFLDREESLDMKALADELRERGDDELVQKFQRLRGMEDLSPDEQKIWGNIQPRLKFKSRRFVRNLLKYAAMIMIPLCVGGALWLLQKERGNVQPVSVASTSIAPGQHKAYLLLSNKVQMDLSRKGADTLFVERGVQVRIDSSGKISYQDAERQPANKELVYHTMVVPKAGEYFLELPDGTKVWLNSFSELKFPINFRGGERKVYLKGEAYFEVAKDASKPFYVMLDDMAVKVLGTSFNVNAYRDRGNVLTTLVTGKIEILDTLGKSLAVLNPSEQADFSNSKVDVTRVNVDNCISWREGKFYFEAMRLEDIMLQLQRWYDIEVFFASENLKNKTFTGVVRRDLVAGEIFSIIEKTTRVKFEENGKCVIISYQ